MSTMINKESLLYEKQKEVYSFYNDRLRWVIIFIESRYKKFPVPILNEIRAVQDHVARCFEDENSNNEEFIVEQFRAVKGHYLRCLLDGYKYIWYQYSPEIKKKYFWAKILGDLHSIDNGEFVKLYLSCVAMVLSALRWKEAKPSSLAQKSPRECLFIPNHPTFLA